MSMQPSTERLFSAAGALQGLRTGGEIARALDVLPQPVSAWIVRGVSREGALLAQEVLGCDANWVLKGVGSMVPGQPRIREVLGADAVGSAPARQREQLGTLLAGLVDRPQDATEGLVTLLERGESPKSQGAAMAGT